MGGSQSRDASGAITPDGYRQVPFAAADGLLQPGDGFAHLQAEQAFQRPIDDIEDESVPSVIQFSCAVYYCEEAEGQMSVDVVRLGVASGSATVEWRTEDSSAKAGVKYEASWGQLDFAPGETMKTVTIALLNDDAWDATLEFSAVLSHAHGAQLGKYLSRCRIKIIDDDVFPTNVYDSLLRNLQADKIPGAALMMQYLKMCWRNGPIRNDSSKQVIFDQLKGVYFILQLYLQMYLVDVVLAPSDNQSDDPRRLLKSTISSGGREVARMLGADDEPSFIMHTMLIPGHRRETAMVIAMLWIVPFGVLHLIDLWKCYLRIPGAARKCLQANLLRRFLHYREDTRATMGAMETGELTLAMIRDVHEVVDFGYMKVLEVFRIIGKLMCALIFILAENQTAVIPLVVYPIILGTFLCCREAKTVSNNDKLAAKQDELVQTVNDATNNYRLIADFHLRPLMVDTYEQRIEAFHERESVLCAVIVNNSYLAPWLTTLSIGLYIIVGAYEVATLGGPLSLGAFLATIHVFKDVGSEMQEIYGECLEIQRAFGPLKKICHFMNMETDLPQRLRINRMRRKQGEEARQRLRQNSGRGGPSNGTESAFAVDMVEIEVTNLSFQYVVNAPPVMMNVNLTFPQGQLYAFVGPPHEGKATLLKLLGQVLLPQEGGGSIFVPAHLRILHVSQEFVILPASMMKNITLDADIKKLGGPDRILRIATRLGFSPALLQTLSRELAEAAGQAGGAASSDVPPSAIEDEGTPWNAQFTGTDHARMTLARVFAMNPEYIVFHKPASSFNEFESKKMIGTIRSHVDERGLELSVLGRACRRPRTVFFTSSSLSGVLEADRVYRISAEGVWQIDKDKVDERLLQ